MSEATHGSWQVAKMMRGRAVIAADIGRLGEVVDNCVLKFPAGNAEALAAHLRQVLQEPELLTELESKARARALQLFHEVRMVEEHYRVYEQPAKGKP